MKTYTRFIKSANRRRLFALDIGEDHLAGLILEQHANNYVVTAHPFIRWESRNEDLEPALQQLLEGLDINGLNCICGLPLSWLNIRHVTLPFTDSRKIEQILPGEMEDALIEPVDELILDYRIIRQQEGKSLLLVFALAKERMHRIGDALKDAGLNLLDALPAIVPLADGIASYYDQDTLLHFHAELSSLSLSLAEKGSCLLHRRLSYPEKGMGQPPVVQREGHLEIVDAAGLREKVHSLAEEVIRSLKFLSLNEIETQIPKKIILSGPLAALAELPEMLETEYRLPVELLSLQEATWGKISALQTRTLQGIYETALFLGLHGFGKKRKQHFCKGEFATGASLFSPKSLLAVTGVSLLLFELIFSLFLGIQNSSLNNKNNALNRQSLQLYHELFPDEKRVQDPYIQLKVALQKMQQTDSSSPIIIGEKRILGILSDISTRLPKNLPLHVARLVIDQKSIRISGFTETFNTVDQIKGILDKSAKFSGVQIDSATLDRKSGKIRFDLQLEVAQ